MPESKPILPESNPMWGGSYAMAPAEIMTQINASIGVDKRLYAQDIQGSLAHAAMLVQQGILTEQDGEAIAHGLHAIHAQIEAGEFMFSEALEDIHMNIEARLAEQIGEVAGRLHTARSRNDQVATDFRLFVRNACDETGKALKMLQAALLARAEEHAASMMPGFTHLQVAQPITLGHHLLAYVEMFGRDASRFADARARMNESPLGAAALAGTSFPTDRHATAAALGFTHPMHNSLDAVSDRDFALEFLSASAICAVHLSRLAEEFIIWSSTQFAFIRFSDQFSTGSSIMPQKRNPDGAELVRGKSGRMVGNLMSLLTTMKALPLAYNKDMQEDKEPVFDSVDTLTACLRVTTGMVADFTANTLRLREQAASGYATATDLADWLVRELKLPFRQAHHVVAKLVAMAMHENVTLEQLSLAQLQSVEPRITESARLVLGVEQSVNSRTSFGGTAVIKVREAIGAARERFAL